jgi:hypothetical protein
MIVVYFQWSKNPQIPEQISKSEENLEEVKETIPDQPKASLHMENNEPENEDNSSVKIENKVRELGKNFIYLIANYNQFEMLDYYIKPKVPFDKSDSTPIEK